MPSRRKDMACLLSCPRSSKILEIAQRMNTFDLEGAVSYGCDRDMRYAVGTMMFTVRDTSSLQNPRSFVIAGFRNTGI